VNPAGNAAARTVLPSVALGDVKAWERWGAKSPETVETRLADFTGLGDATAEQCGLEGNVPGPDRADRGEEKQAKGSEQVTE
jgi:hypothetical protein